MRLRAVVCFASSRIRVHSHISPPTPHSVSLWIVISFFPHSMQSSVSNSIPDHPAPSSVAIPSYSAPYLNVIYVNLSFKTERRYYLRLYNQKCHNRTNIKYYLKLNYDMSIVTVVSNIQSSTKVNSSNRTTKRNSVCLALTWRCVESQRELRRNHGNSVGECCYLIYT